MHVAHKASISRVVSAHSLQVTLGMSAGLVATTEPGNRKPFERGPEPVQTDDQEPGSEGNQLEHAGQDT